MEDVLKGYRDRNRMWTLDMMVSSNPKRSGQDIATPPTADGS